MAAINFYVGDSFSQDLAGDGLGFYGSGFGVSVPVGEYQDSTFVCDSSGVIEGAEALNVKYVDANTGEVAGPTELALTSIPNALASLNIRFTHGSDVRVQNASLTIYDRVAVANAPVGVTCKVAELLHTSPTQGAGGSGDSSWSQPMGATGMSLADSPATSGLEAGNGVGSVAEDVRHDWYVALSASPDSIGSKTNFGLYVSLEYL